MRLTAMGRKAFYLQFLLFWIALLDFGSASVRIRLNGSNSSSEGRIEVQYRGVWGTICDDYWSLDNAHVVCRMLGFARAFLNKRFGQGTGKIWLDDVSCKGTETSIDECSHRGWGSHNCFHGKDIGVVCTNGYPNIAVRMVNGSLPHGGQIEIRYHEVWKLLCDNYWSLQDAHVACRMLGYSQGAAFGVQGYQIANSDAWDTQISCSGTETSIDKCKVKHWGEKDCSSDYRAGVVCLSKAQVSNLAVRLVNGSTPNQGRVEVRYYGVWGTICGRYWGIGHAHVVCHMLNYSKALKIEKSKNPGSGPILLENFYCSGFEDSLENCWKQGWSPYNCRHNENVEVTCEYGPRAYPDISVRLVNTTFAYAGQIEMRYYGVWKPVCDSYWTKKDADVTCRMLGYSQGAALPVQGYQSTSGDAWYTQIGCSGTETSIDKCRHLYWKQSSCDNDYRAGVVCLTSGQYPNVAVRLVDGSTPNQGRVEVRYYGIWGTVCDDYWGIINAHIVCRMLNYSKALWTGTANVRGIGPILLDNVYCSGYESSLESCWNVGWGEHNCVHFEDVGVTCENETKAQSPDVAVRLVNGRSLNEGRVEVRYNGVWGTVCDDNWDRADAHVVCRMLNYSKASWAGNALVSGRGPIALDEVQCRGNEKSIGYCPKRKWGWHNCYHFEDAGVKCEKLSKDELKVTARLIGTDYKHMGIVEVNYNDTWRPICDDTWDILDAHVVCGMLGYKAALLGIKGYRVRKVTGLWMGNVECSGNEKLVSECYHRGWTNTWCPGKVYAGVMCNATNEFPSVQVRLEDGSSPNSGRVAIRYASVWGTICRDELDINAAKVMCRMLGYPGIHYKYDFKPGSGVIWLMSLQCDGTEKSIVDCRHGWGNAATCSHDGDVAIMCKKGDAPGFQLNGTNAITETTVGILFKEAQQSIGIVLKSVYQVAVEKRKLEKNFQTNGQTVPSVFVDNENVTMETSKSNNSYITAEIPGNSSSLTIGDGQYYHGYYNAPLEPGCLYIVYVRAVTKTVEKKPIYSDSVFLTFTTKRQANSKKATSGRQGRRTSFNYKATVIGLSVVIFVLVIIGIGYSGWCYLKKKRASQKESTTDHSGNEPSTPHYQRLSYPTTRGNTERNHSQANRPSSAENEPPTPHYQRLSYPATQGNTERNHNQANRPSSTENEPSTPHYQRLSYPATRADTAEGGQSQSNRLYEPSTPRYQPLSYPATRADTAEGGQSQSNRLSSTENEPSTPHYQPLSHPSVQDSASDVDANQNRPSAMLKTMYRKRLPETPSASIVSGRNEPSTSNNHSLYFPSDYSGIENQTFSMSDIRLQELSFGQRDQET